MVIKIQVIYQVRKTGNFATLKMNISQFIYMYLEENYASKLEINSVIQRPVKKSRFCGPFYAFNS